MQVTWCERPVLNSHERNGFVVVARQETRRRGPLVRRSLAPDARELTPLMINGVQKHLLVEKYTGLVSIIAIDSSIDYCLCVETKVSGPSEPRS